MEKLLSLPAERRRLETFTTPELVTTRRSILGPPAERPGPSDDDDEPHLGASLAHNLSLPHNLDAHDHHEKYDDEEKDGDDDDEKIYAFK